MSDYYADPRLSASKLKNYLGHDPAIAYHMETNSGPSSDALKMGTALHAFMEGETPTVSPFESYRTKDARDWRDSHPDALTATEFTEVAGWRDAIAKHLGTHHQDLFDCWKLGTYEEEFFTDKYKAKIDCIYGDVVLDWKTTRHTKAGDVIREYQRYGAALQAAHYLDLSGGRVFHFIVVSKVAPHPVWVLTCSDKTIAHGLRIRRECEAIREKFMLAGHQDALTLDPPAWAEENFEDVTI